MKSRALFFYVGVFFLFLGYFVLSYPDVIFSQMSFARRDIIRYYYPMWHYGVESIKNGFVPFWNPYHSFGKPFAANIQNCVFYPLQAILYLPNFTWAFNFYVLFHLALSGLFTMLWMRDLGASKPAAGLAGFAYAVSGYMASAINLTISLCSAVYFPLVLLCFRRSLLEKRFLWRAGLAATLALQYLAGDPSIIFSTLVVLSVFTAYLCARQSAEQRRLVFSPLGRLCVSVAAFLGLTAFHYPLFYEFLKNSTRSEMSYDWATMWSVQLNDLAGIVIPFFSDVSSFFMDYWVKQSWLENYYAGATVILLAVCAICWKRDRIRAYHFLLFLFGLSLSLGRFSGVYWFFNKFFPFFELIRYPVRFFYISYFAGACLAGWALDDLWNNRLPKAPEGRAAARKWILSAVGMVAGAAMIWTMIALSKSFAAQADMWTHSWLMSMAKDRVWPQGLVEDLTRPLIQNVERSLILLLLAAAVILAWRSGHVRGKIAGIFIAVLVLADLSIANTFEMPIHGRYLSKRGPNVTRVLEDKGLFRVVASGALGSQQNLPMVDNIPEAQHALMQSFSPNLLIPFHIQDMGGYDSLFLTDTSNFVDWRLTIRHPGETRYFDAVNVKYYVSARKDLPEPMVLLRSSVTSLYTNPRVLPRAYLVRRAVVELEWKKALKQMADKDFDPEGIIFVSENPGWLGPDQKAPDGEGRVEIERYSPNEIAMNVESPGQRWLFLSDSFYPGWHAFVDGVEVKIVKANTAFRAIQIGAGTHRVLWKYEPTSFKMGLTVSILTALCLMGVIIRSFRYGY